jgi:hypothetical protein
MGIFSKPTKWIKKQTHGGLKKGLSASGLKSTIKGAAKNPLTYAAAGLLIPGAAPAMLGLAKKGISKVGGLFKGGVESSGDFVDQTLQGGDIASGNPGRFRQLASGVGKFIGGSDGIGMDDVLKYGKAAGDAYGAYTGAKNQDRYRQIAEQQFAANAPLRDAGRSMLLDNSTPDLSGVFADPQNPQGRYRKVSVGSRVV